MNFRIYNYIMIFEDADSDYVLYMNKIQIYFLKLNIKL